MIPKTPNVLQTSFDFINKSLGEFPQNGERDICNFSAQDSEYKLSLYKRNLLQPVTHTVSFVFTCLKNMNRSPETCFVFSRCTEKTPRSF